MPAKTPIYLKVANNKKGKKCKLRDILSPDLISPPLGDFRHTIHIGKEGQHDVFGDISFLQGKYDLLPGNQGKPRVGQYGGHNEFLRANSTSDSTFSETPSPVLKNAISLPAIGGSQALTLPLLTPVTFTSKQDSMKLPTPNPPRLSSSSSIEEQLQEKSKQFKDEEMYRVDNTLNLTAPASYYTNGGFNYSSSLSGRYFDWKNNVFEDEEPSCDLQSELEKPKSNSEQSLSDCTGSLLSLQLDLGPSLLDEVLNVMDKNKV
ncbi:cdc42 effector protein 3 [Latimeria chalumnae]|uniref:CDC42 effector protein 3 n=1 Tax=Latimeria chalumnae TaxID=7897 RepID=H3B386_LATCH|nr:PREDICTED: cdc42 effector protein 3 [Latimeria chalumnae]|eukprot:XP_005996886.1 PREDICTED: cdc42 effector protein 3 [Latimeria chalumnae]